jgi:hypothetical protein
MTGALAARAALGVALLLECPVRATRGKPTVRPSSVQAALGADATTSATNRAPLPFHRGACASGHVHLDGDGAALAGVMRLGMDRLLSATISRTLALR